MKSFSPVVIFEKAAENIRSGQRAAVSSSDVYVDEIDIRTEVELATAKLAHRNDREAVQRFSGNVMFAPQSPRANPICSRDQSFRQEGQRRKSFFDRAQPQQVADPM